MPFGIGPAGWAYVNPYLYPYRYPYGGYGYFPWGPLPKEQEIAMLEDQARFLERDLGAIKGRLEELKK